jgi:hypothetical protein
VSGVEIGIAYGRPAVKERKVWGGLVPNGRVWRAGANEATRFTFNHEVKIEGHALAAGTYTFFVIPGETEWTVIFNRVPRQWGAFDYNPAFDALRFPVRPAEVPHEEYLRYTIQPAGSNAAVVTLAWEKRAVAFRIAVFIPAIRPLSRQAHPARSSSRRWASLPRPRPARSLSGRGARPRLPPCRCHDPVTLRL